MGVMNVLTKYVAGNFTFYDKSTGNNILTLSPTAVTIGGNATLSGNITSTAATVTTLYGGGNFGNLTITGNTTVSSGNVTITTGNLSVPNMRNTFTANGTFWFDGNTTKVRA